MDDDLSGRDARLRVLSEEEPAAHPATTTTGYTDFTHEVCETIGRGLQIVHHLNRQVERTRDGEVCRRCLRWGGIPESFINPSKRLLASWERLFIL